MSPILVRPVREQLEHDRVIRLLQARYKRRFAVGINPGADMAAPVGAAPDVQYPDLVLTAPGGGKKLAGVVEVETSESVNQLEAMAQWSRLGRLPVDFILYIPSGVAGVAREEGFEAIAAIFEHIGVAEKGHEMRYRALLENLQKGRVFKRENTVRWRCRNCGYIHEGAEAPGSCPACAHPQAFFEVLVETY